MPISMAHYEKAELKHLCEKSSIQVFAMQNSLPANKTNSAALRDPYITHMDQ